MGLDPEAQLTRKRGKLVRALAAYPTIAAAPVAPTVGAQTATAFRLRSKLVSDGRSLGLFARGTHDIVDIPGCVVERPRVHAVAASLRAHLAELGAVSSFDLREADDGVLVTAAVPAAMPAARRRELAECIAALDANVVSVAVSERAHDAPQVLGAELEVLVGPAAVRHQPDPDAPWHYAAHGAFTQAHGEQLALLHAAVERELAHGATAPRVLELYAGSGALSLRLAARGFAVTLVESFEPAVAMAKRAAAEQDLSLAGITADAAAAVSELARRGERFDAVIVNPPRRGIAPEVRRLAAELAPARLIYISCEPETLARDAAHLATLGYELEQATPFDMIPLSDAVETLAVFRPAPARPPLVLAENDAFIVVDKAPHVAVAGTADERGTLRERVRRLPGAEAASAVDELAHDASGAVVFARRDADSDAVKRTLTTARVEVLALVRGVIRLSGKLPNDRELGPAARYERVAVHGGHSLVRVYAPAGAFDAAARAFARFGHPLLGDSKFGDRRANVHVGLRHGLDRTFWHRAELELAWNGAEIRARARLAPDLERVLASLDGK